MNIGQVNEAITLEIGIDGEIDAIKFPELALIFDAARRFVDGWETCPTCNGSGTLALVDPNGEPNPKFCPDCVDGMTPSPEALERGAIAAWNDAEPTPGMAWELIPEGQQQRVRRMTRAVLLASRRGKQ